jgi:hypothetical protein
MRSVTKLAITAALTIAVTGACDDEKPLSHASGNEDETQTTVPADAVHVQAFIDVIDSDRGVISYDEIESPDDEFLAGPILNAPISDTAVIDLSDIADQAAGTTSWDLEALSTYASEVQSVFELALVDGSVVAVTELESPAS